MENKIFKKIDNEKIISLFKELNNEVKKIDLVYHYTTIGSLYNIIKSGEFWISSIQEMNDPLELKFGKQIIKDKILKDIPNKEKLIELIDKLEFAGREMERNIYVFSTSKNNDSYQQWINYSDKGSGISLGLDRSEIFNFFNSNLDEEEFIYALPIQYYSEDYNIIDGIGEVFEDKINTLLSEIYNSILNDKNKDSLIKRLEEFNILIALISTLFKDSFHKDEKEVRFLIFTKKELNFENVEITNDKLKNVYKTRFYSKPTAMKRYNEDEIMGKSLSFLKKIIVGPKNPRDESLKNTIKLLISSHCRDMENSDISFSSGQIQ